MVNYRHALQKFDKHAKVAVDVLIWDLVTEHVNKFDAGGLEQRQVFKVILDKLWVHQLLNVLEKGLLWDLKICCSIAVCVGRDARGDQKVEESCLFTPLLISIGAVVLEVRVNIVADEPADIIRELLGKLLNKLHAMPPPRFHIRFFKIVSNVSIGIVLVLIRVVLSDCDVW